MKELNKSQRYISIGNRKIETPISSLPLFFRLTLTIGGREDSTWHLLFSNTMNPHAHMLPYTLRNSSPSPSSFYLLLLTTTLPHCESKRLSQIDSMQPHLQLWKLGNIVPFLGRKPTSLLWERWFRGIVRACPLTLLLFKSAVKTSPW